MGPELAIGIACVALTAAVFVFVFLIDRDPADDAPHRTKLDQLLERRDTIYDNLRDLKFEYRAGKLGEKDYEETRKLLEDEAAVVLAEIELAAGGVVSPAQRQAATRARRA